MRHEDHSHDEPSDKNVDVRLEIYHRDKYGQQKKDSIRVTYCWTTLSEGAKVIKYARRCDECSHKVNGRFTNVSRWQVKA